MESPPLALVFSQDHQTRVDLRRALERLGLRVVSAASPRDADRTLQTPERACLIFVDFDFVSLGPREFLQEILASRQQMGVPVVQIAGPAGIEGVSARLEKPLTGEALDRLLPGLLSAGA